MEKERIEESGEKSVAQKRKSAKVSVADTKGRNKG
jgi:hypothetical protein